jgi:hypothetical protein
LTDQSDRSQNICRAAPPPRFPNAQKFGPKSAGTKNEVPLQAKNSLILSNSPTAAIFLLLPLSKTKQPINHWNKNNLSLPIHHQTQSSTHHFHHQHITFIMSSIGQIFRVTT